MAIKIPRREIKVGPNEVLIGDSIYPRRIPSFQTNAEINPEDYVLVQKEDGTVRHAMSMRQELNGLNAIDANREALNMGLFVPGAELFMPHYRNANLALNREGVLYDASGRLLEGKRLENYVNGLNSDRWVSLNNFFVRGNGFRNLSIARVTGFDEEGKPTYETNPLERCLHGEDILADLSLLNSQGLPIRKSKSKGFVQGKNFYYWQPEDNSVAWFDADSGWTNFDGGRDAQDSRAAVGVFLCAAGNEKNPEK